MVHLRSLRKNHMKRNIADGSMFHVYLNPV
jgi:hypothetical protein